MTAMISCVCYDTGRLHLPCRVYTWIRLGRCKSRLHNPPRICKWVTQTDPCHIFLRFYNNLHSLHNQSTFGTVCHYVQTCSGKCNLPLCQCNVHRRRKVAPSNRLHPQSPGNEDHDTLMRNGTSFACYVASILHGHCNVRCSHKCRRFATCTRNAFPSSLVDTDTSTVLLPSDV